MRFQKGDKIGPYVVAFSGKQGAYAESYRVKDPSGKTRWMKLISYSKLHREQIDDNGKIIEVEIARLIKHRNLCRYVDSGILIVEGGQREYLVTEYVSGEPLSQRVIRNGELSVYQIKQVAVHVLSALQHLHTLPRPVIHGDVTMQNVLISLVAGFDDLKLIDFGHARYIDQPPIRPDLDHLNPFYLAPEALSGVFQVQSDLYSVGVLMYHLLYGQLPWFIDLSRIDKQNRTEALLAERDKELELHNLDIFEFDNQLTNCIAKALAYDVENRFQSATEFINAINGEIKIERQPIRRKVKYSESHSNKPQNTPISIKKGEGFAAIAGMEELKAKLREEVIEPLHNPEEYRRYGINIPNGMLLYGPPGCGKTFFAKHFAEEVGFNFVYVTPATLKSRYVNATQENIAKMFKEAEEKAPTIIFIDEMNELVPNRENDVHEMTRSAVNEMLAQMDQTGERGIFVIGATNYPHTIDPAIMRAGRMDKKYYVGVPDTEARKAIFRLYLEQRPYDFGLNYDELAQLTENYVSADIQMIVNDASRTALKLHSKITMEIIKRTISETRPSLQPSELARYEKIKAQVEGQQPRDKRPKVGFN